MPLSTCHETPYGEMCAQRLSRVERQDFLDGDLVLPVVPEVVHVLELFLRPEIKPNKADLIGVIGEGNATFIRDTVLLAANQ